MRPSSLLRSVFLFLFALPFLGGGIKLLGDGLSRAAGGARRDDTLGLLLAGSLFALFGGILFTLAAVELWHARSRSRRAHAQPDAPWLWRPDWAEGRIRYSARSRALLFAGVGFLILALSAPILLLLPGKVVDEQELVFLIALIFPIAGLVFLAFAARRALDLRRFGTSVLELAFVPGVVGGRFGGVVRIAAKVEPEEGFTARLVSVLRVVTGSGNNRSVRETVLFEEQQTGLRDLAPDQLYETAVPISFALPASCEGTTPGLGPRRVVWRLVVEGRLPGVDYRSRFEVPVFRTGASPEVAVPADDVRATGKEDGGGAKAKANAAPPEAPGIRFATTLEGHRELAFGAARNRGAALAITVFTLLWGVAPVFLLLDGAPLVFPVVFAATELIFIHAVVTLWTRSTRTVIEADRIRVETRTLGLRREREIPIEAVEGVEVTTGMTAGQKVYRDLWLRATGRRIQIGSAIPDVRLAEYLAAQVEREIERLAPRARAV